MHRFVKTRATLAWLVLLSILFSGLMPALSHATAVAPQPNEEMQICTMAGMKTIVVQDSSGKPAPPDHMLKHCPYCVSHGGTAPFLPGAAFVFTIPVSPTGHPPLFYQSATPLFAWTPAAPRGPPTLR